MGFTDTSIERLKPRKKKYDRWEGHGFGIRVRPSGSKSWLYAYRFRGRSRMMTLGQFPRMSLLDARIAHTEARKLLAKDIDPGVQKVAENEIERHSVTVQQLAEDYLNKWAKAHKRTWQEDHRVLHKDVISVIGGMKAKDVTRREVMQILDAVSARGAKTQINRTRACMSRMFSWALERGMVEYNPCARIKKIPEIPRERTLSKSEMRTLWNKLDGCKGSLAVKTMIKLLVLTGQRRSEVAGMEWDEIQGEWWTIPGSRTKNKRPHRVYLTDNAKKLINAMPRRSRFIFPSRIKDAHLTARMVNDVLYGCRDHLRISNWTVHDIRRTVATGMIKEGVSEYVVSRTLNHIDSGVTTKHYNVHSYSSEKEEAMLAWERHLAGMLSIEDTSSGTLRWDHVSLSL